MGAGKLEWLRERLQSGGVDTVICDDELTPTQQRNLQVALGEETKVIDRTALILDVFAQRANSREGRLQVELAQHEYLMPRLRGQWTHLERQGSTGLVGGGIGTRGPGETQIETDRRLIRNKVSRIKKELDNVRRHRAQYRAKRRSEGIPVVSLVGYTNAGKSTLLNALTEGGSPSEDRLFSTLDPLTRRLRLPSGRTVLLTDTVGFIQKLPTTVVAAFRATLEEIGDSTLIAHVVDLSHPKAAEQAEVVEAHLADLGLAETRRLLALNKLDLLEVSDSGEERPGAATFRADRPGTLMISATTGAGLDDLRAEMDEAVGDFFAPGTPVEVRAG